VEPSHLAGRAGAIAGPVFSTRRTIEATEDTEFFARTELASNQPSKPRIVRPALRAKNSVSSVASLFLCVRKNAETQRARAVGRGIGTAPREQLNEPDTRGLVPAIHDFAVVRWKDMDGRHETGHDDRGAVLARPGAFISPRSPGVRGRADAPYLNGSSPGRSIGACPN
jgi:hypothetical protein